MFNVGIRLYDNSIYSVGDTSTPEGARIAVTTIVDNQKTAEVEIYLINEKNRDKKYSYIGKIIIHNIPPAKAGEPRINLVITSDKEQDLKVSVFNKEEPCGQMEIPYKRWHPEMREEEELKEKVKKEEKKEKIEEEEETIETTILREEIKYTSTGEYELDFDSRSYQTDKSSSTRLTTAAETKSVKSGETEEKKDKKPILFIIGGIAALIVICLFVVLFLFKPWESKGPAVRDLSQRGDETDVSTTEEMMESEKETVVAEQEVTTEETIITEPAVNIEEIHTAIQAIGPVYFPPDSSRLISSSIETINRISTLLADYNGKIRINISGHTAKYGTVEEQEELSVERAMVVRSRLIKKGAITEELCTYEGFGARVPATTERSKDNLNRRVEATVLEK
jgi:outer membrane protein OmpA-like peptidoglycan-associated protein